MSKYIGNLLLKKTAEAHPTFKIMTSLGWYLYNACTCGGILQFKYRHEEKKKRQVDIRPNLKNVMVWGTPSPVRFGISELYAEVSKI